MRDGHCFSSVDGLRCRDQSLARAAALLRPLSLHGSRGALRVIAELTNATDRENLCCSTLEFERDANGHLVARARRQTWLPVVQSVSVAWEF
jgi:hypothetical protein